MTNNTNAPTEWVIQWLRNNYQDHPNIAGLCDALIEAAPPAPEAGETQSPPVIGWMRLHPNGDPSGEYLSDAAIDDVRRRSGQWVPLIRQPNDPTPAGTNTTEGA